MTLQRRVLGSGDEWSAIHAVCTADRRTPRFEERHDRVCLAVVVRGTFLYRNAFGSALMVPGTVLLGNAGSCFECGHDHGKGDQCVSFHLTSSFLEDVARGIPGLRRAEFHRVHLPLGRSSVGLVAEAERSSGSNDTVRLEEYAIRIAASCLTLQDDLRVAGTPSGRDTRRINDVVRLIDSDPQRAFSLADLAHAARSSRFHFLRTFRQVVGVPPHQYLLTRRLMRACSQLKSGAASITVVAQDAGFNDLSAFNRHFKRALGMTPNEFRRGSR